MGRKLADHSESPVRDRGGSSPRRSKSPLRRERSPVRHRDGSPISRSPSPRAKRLRRAQVERDVYKVVEKEHERNRGKTREKDARSAISWSPSPRTKRLRIGQGEKEAAKVTEREYGKNHSRGSEKVTRRERGSDHEPGSDRKERRGFDRDFKDERKDRGLGRDEVSNKSSRARHKPLDQRHRSRHRSHSPQSADGARARHEVSGGKLEGLNTGMMMMIRWLR